MAPTLTPRTTPHIDLRANFTCEPDFLVFLSSAYAFSATLFSAVELGVFDRLEQQPRSVADLASELAAPVAAVERLIVVLHAMGLVERDSADRYRNHPTASALLVSTSSTNMCSFLIHQQRHIYPLFAHVTEAIRTGQPQTNRWRFADGSNDSYQALMQTPAECRLFLEAMNTAAVGVGTAIAKGVDFSGVRTLIDFGGGGGQIAIELARAVPHLSIQIVDYAEACRFADEEIVARGLGERIATVCGDFLGDVPATLAPADAVLLGGVLADWDADNRRRLLANARRCLRPGGRLLVSETLLDDSNDGPLLPALLSLTMLVGARGKNFTPSEVTEILTAAGFTDITVISNRHVGVRDVVVATSPGANV